MARFKIKGPFSFRTISFQPSFSGEPQAKNLEVVLCNIGKPANVSLTMRGQSIISFCYNQILYQIALIKFVYKLCTIIYFMWNIDVAFFHIVSIGILIVYQVYWQIAVCLSDYKSQYQ